MTAYATLERESERRAEWWHREGAAKHRELYELRVACLLTHPADCRCLDVLRRRLGL